VSAIAIACIVFACVFGGALIGMLLHGALPAHHLADESKDVMKLGMGLVATMAALVLGLLIASAKSAYEAQRTGFEQMAANVILLDVALAHFGPDAGDARAALRQTLTIALQRIWPQDSAQSSRLDAPQTTAGGQTLLDRIQKLSPRDDAQRWLQSQALQIAVELGRTRWLLFEEQQGTSIPMPFLAVLVFWLAMLFGSFGLFARPNATIIATLLVCALSVSGAIFLILEMDHPFKGMMQISSAPLHSALVRLGM
jgi:flagellar biosynthesis component FlhA